MTPEHRKLLARSLRLDGLQTPPKERLWRVDYSGPKGNNRTIVNAESPGAVRRIFAYMFPGVTVLKVTAAEGER
jgi:hypothetical protein